MFFRISDTHIRKTNDDRLAGRVLESRTDELHATPSTDEMKIPPLEGPAALHRLHKREELSNTAISIVIVRESPKCTPGWPCHSTWRPSSIGK